MKTRKSTLLDMLKSAGKDPSSHDEWIAAWQDLYGAFENGVDSQQSFSSLEHEALASLLSVNIHGTSDRVSNEVCRALDTFKFPAMLVGADGQVTAQNAMVDATYNINVGENIESLPFVLDRSESLRDVIRQVSKSGTENDDALFRQAIDLNSANEFTLAITNSTNTTGGAVLVFVINAGFSDTAARLIEIHYDLTCAEREILTSFVEGYSLKDIARERHRSLATIRTQFNSMMNKMGAHSQASLLRTALSLSDFTKEIDKVSHLLEHPHRRQITIMRIGGRMVEIGFCGNPSGTPILHIPCLAQNTFNAAVERAFFNAGLYVITIVPPAQGKTDPPQQGDCKNSTRIDDVKNVLDILGIDSCPVLVSRTCTHEGFNLAATLPERVSRLILLSACPLGEYWPKHGTGAHWFDAALCLGEKYPTMKKIIITAGLKAGVAIGAKQFYQLQLSGNPKDLEVQMRPENVREVQSALDSATVFGTSAVVDEVAAVLGNYRDSVQKSSCDVSIIHGVQDLAFPIAAMREFKADYPERVELFEFEDAGFTVLLTHTEEVVKLLAEFAVASEDSRERSLSVAKSMLG